ncbi:glycosyltransferase family 2 protein [Nonlabens sp. Asnod3-H03]|uniref:glycosyltransferase family 2 protein n=1 Tax=Nonlabens sp. Asnod3-H03 TaxID=3160580 RepID=UPI00386B908D
MNLSLIICTYMRPEPLTRLMESVMVQTQVPEEILIIDGSTDDETETRFRESGNKIIKYYKVPPDHRGLTKQRNYGIERVQGDMDIVAFLDDDTILSSDYFENLVSTYAQYPKAVGVGGYITNEVSWEESSKENPADLNYYYYDGYRRVESSRYKLRRKLGLAQTTKPAVYPEFGHGRSISFLPPSGKIYKVEQLMGGVSSFPLAVLKEHKFSEYFEGYGLYEDADFTLRLSNIGDLYVNTAAQLEHHHDAAGRPNKYRYGKMVVRNGWYVWRVKHPNPSFKNKVKWYQITILLTAIRFLNIFTTSERKEAFTEAMGRIVGILSLIFNKPN